MYLGGRKDKDDVLRRLLERFEKRVERLGGEHMHLVHNVDAEPCTVGLELHLVDNIADILDFAVGRGVHLDDIEHAAVLDALADLAHTARIAVLGIEAVCRLCQNFGAGGLARTARACEQVGVGEPVFDDFIFQRGRDMLLTGDVLKGFGTPFAIKHLIQ